MDIMLCLYGLNPENFPYGCLANPHFSQQRSTKQPPRPIPQLFQQRKNKATTQLIPHFFQVVALCFLCWNNHGIGRGGCFVLLCWKKCGLAKQPYGNSGRVWGGKEFRGRCKKS